MSAGPVDAEPLRLEIEARARAQAELERIDGLLRQTERDLSAARRAASRRRRAAAAILGSRWARSAAVGVRAAVAGRGASDGERSPCTVELAPADAAALAAERDHRSEVQRALRERRLALALAEWRLAALTDPRRRRRRRRPPAAGSTAGASRGFPRAGEGGASICVVVGCRDWEAARASGDLYLAEALCRALSARGHTAAVALATGQDEFVAGFAVALHMRGRVPRRPRAGQLSCIWVMSHPDEVAHDEVARFDLVLAASDAYARRLGEALGRPVHVFEQFTDPDLFRPTPAAAPRHELLFVGNWRSVYRRAVWAARRAGFDPALYGAGWRLLAPECLVREHVSHGELPALYSSAAIVLNDHWDDMRDAGFVSSRVFDALACGAFVLSDENPGLPTALDGAVETFRDAEDFRAKADRYLADPDLRAELAARGRSAILARHTADHRAGRLLELLAEAGA